jgi:hypothetical protein
MAGIKMAFLDFYQIPGFKRMLLSSHSLVPPQLPTTRWKGGSPAFPAFSKDEMMKLEGKITQIASIDTQPSGHHKIPRIWIVVADQRIARIFKKSDSHLELIGEALPIRIGNAPKACLTIPWAG